VTWSGARPPRAGILIFDGVEVLDFAGPYEVLSGARRATGETYFETLTVGPKSEVACFGGLKVLPDALLDACPPLDLLIVPGGPGAREKLPEDQRPLLDFILRRGREVDVLASVCTGSFLLGRAGLLDGKRATTHSLRLDLFRDEFPAVAAEEAKIVDLGRVVTAGGVSSGIDLALHLLERWFGPEARAAEAVRLEGPWR
jgi:transcriptional regulator GlxA family with amidase domain